MKYIRKSAIAFSIYCYWINIRARIWQLDGGWRRASAARSGNTRILTLYLSSGPAVYIARLATRAPRLHRRYCSLSDTTDFVLDTFRSVSRYIDPRVNRNKRGRCNRLEMMQRTTSSLLLERVSISLIILRPSTKIISYRSIEEFLMREIYKIWDKYR